MNLYFSLQHSIHLHYSYSYFFVFPVLAVSTHLSFSTFVGMMRRNYFMCMGFILSLVWNNFNHNKPIAFFPLLKIALEMKWWGPAFSDLVPTPCSSSRTYSSNSTSKWKDRFLWALREILKFKLLLIYHHMPYDSELTRLGAACAGPHVLIFKIRCSPVDCHCCWCFAWSSRHLPRSYHHACCRHRPCFPVDLFNYTNSPTQIQIVEH